MKSQNTNIQSLLKRVSARQYGKYLLEMNLHNVRAFVDQKITLTFPVTAIIGTNGGGKSTILGAAALAYKSAKPGDYFPKSNVGDSSMANWRIDYEILDRPLNNKGPLTRNARFVAAKWRRDDLLDRDLVVFPIQRTVPASEQKRYKKFIGMYNIKSAIIVDLPEMVRKHAGWILGKDLSKFKTAKIKKSDEDYLLIGYQKNNDYSQFHFGAGEASIISMVSKIESADNEALILIEEIENGLHPIATERMVDYLLDVAQRKRLQVLFTTHSEYALKQLPQEAIWACIDGQAYNGRLSIDSLRALIGNAEKDKVIFVEDEFAKDWVEDIIRQHCSKYVGSSEIHVAGGYPHIIEVTKHHNNNPSIKKKAIAIVDGDVVTDPSPNVYQLPGILPELEIFGFIEDNLDNVISLIQQRCQCPTLEQDKIIDLVKKAKIDASDPHLLFRRLGERLGFISEIVVRRGLISIYDERSSDSVSSLALSLQSFLQE